MTVENPRVEAIKARLAELELERASLLKEMEDLSAPRPSPDVLGSPASDKPLTTPEERIALFMLLAPGLAGLAAIRRRFKN